MSHMKIFVSSWIINSDNKATLGNKSSNTAKDFFVQNVPDLWEKKTRSEENKEGKGLSLLVLQLLKVILVII